MTELVLKNKSIIESLDYIKNELLHKEILVSNKTALMHPEDGVFDGEKYLSEEYLIKHMNDPNHKGFPVEHFSCPVSHLEKNDSSYKNLRNYTLMDFTIKTGANKNAVFLYYPPGGFVGWHTNQNNSGYQFIFSWSERGDGYFQYYDKQKKEIVKLPDKSGWQARYYHFGKDEPDHCWHSAYTNVPRITICVLFRWWDKPHMKEQILEMKDQLIEEIESEE